MMGMDIPDKTWNDKVKEAMERAWSTPPQPFVGLTDEEAEEQGRDRFPQAMVEGSTEYDWSELPEYLKDIMRDAAKEFAHWADNEHASLKGELANELEP